MKKHTLNGASLYRLLNHCILLKSYSGTCRHRPLFNNKLVQVINVPVPFLPTSMALFFVSSQLRRKYLPSTYESTAFAF